MCNRMLWGDVNWRLGLSDMRCKFSTGSPGRSGNPRLDLRRGLSFQEPGSAKSSTGGLRKYELCYDLLMSTR